MSHDLLLCLVVGSTAVDAAVAGLALFGRRPPRGEAEPGVIGLRRLVSAALVTAVVSLLKLVPLRLVGLNAFGAIHLAYADLVVVLPAAGIALLTASRLAVGGRRWRTLTGPARVASLASLALIPIGLYATWIEPFRLQLETARVAVALGRDGQGAIRIGVLSDLQTNRVTDYERDAVDRLMALRPDLIVLPGDLFQGSAEEFEANRAALRDLLGRLSAPGGVYLVPGDVDGGTARLEQAVRSTRVRLLVDEVVQVVIGDRRVTIGGIELDASTRRARETVELLETASGDGDIRILVAHRPDVALGLRPGSRIDLVVAGHTHGGQVVVPGFGPPLTLSRVPRAVAAGGLHAIAGNPIYVSRGVGCERGQAPRIRFLCPPEISLIEVGDRDEH
jgi:uncharacterized protein